MRDIKPKLIKYDPDDEPLVRRLGLALVTQWHSLTDEQRDTMIEQATFTFDREPTTQLKQQLEAFVRKHSQW